MNCLDKLHIRDVARSKNLAGVNYNVGAKNLGGVSPPCTVLRFGVKVAVVRYLNFSKNAKNGFNMQFEFILNVFCQEIDKLLHTSVQSYTETMTTSLSNCLIWQVCY